MRGLKAPPRRSRAPQLFAATATSSICSQLSTAHGPAAITIRRPPTSTALPASPTSTTVGPGRKSRDASLKGFKTRMHSATPGSATNIPASAARLSSPTTPMMVRSSPRERCGAKPSSRMRARTTSISASEACIFMTTIMAGSRAIPYHRCKEPIRGRLFSGSEAECFSDKSAGGLENFVCMRCVRGVAAARQHERLRRTFDLPQDGIDLRRRAVLVVFALHHQYGAPDGRQVLFDVPPGKLRLEPHVRPRSKHRVGVGAVIAREPLPQARRLVFFGDSGDFLRADGLDEDVRRFEDERPNGAMSWRGTLRSPEPPGPRAGVDDRDRGAVAVAEENDLLSWKCSRTAGRTLSASSCMKATGRGPCTGSEEP